MLDAGEVNEESYLYHDQKSFITQSIGGKQIPDFHIEVVPQQYDAFIITTDGIHACFLLRHLQYMLTEANHPEAFCNLLYERSDSPDNSDDRTIALIYP
jgi:serine/threonine protein phosphatase PrpC